MIVNFRGDWWREYWAWFSRAPYDQRFIKTPAYLYNWALISRARKLTVICKWLERTVRRRIPRKRTQVVYAGVDPYQFYNENGFEFQRPAVAIIQNHTILPKVVGLLKFRRIVKMLPDVHFYIAEGENIGRYFSHNFLELVKQCYSNLHNVHFIKGISSPDGVRKMLATSDCYILASELDCCPITVLEASLMRRPVIASRVGGVPEIVLEDKTGWTVPNNLINDWIEKIDLAVTDVKLNRRMGERGREWVSEKFGWRKIANQVENILVEEASC